MSVSFDALENAFVTVIEKNRKRQTQAFCGDEFMSAHAFFVKDDGQEPGMLHPLPETPYEKFWLVTSYRGVGIAACVERIAPGMVRPDYRWYPMSVQQNVHASQDQVVRMVERVIDRALARLSYDREYSDPLTLRNLNAGRLKSKRPIRPLPPFIRIGDTKTIVPSLPSLNLFERQPHDRVGHYRKRKKGIELPRNRWIWVRESKIHGGATAPRIYRRVP